MRNVTLPNRELLPEVAKILSEGNSVTIKAKGDSMLPFIIGNKDSVVLQKKDNYIEGDIVLAEIAPKLFVLHRIITIIDERVILMGDGNVSKTEECRNENICGYAIGIIHKGKIINCNNKRELRKANFWRLLLPMRRYLLAIYKRII